MNISFAEYPGNTTKSGRTISVSTNYCDFAQGWPYQNSSRFSTNTLHVVLGQSSYGYPTLQPRTRYYVNIRNDSCPGPSCDLRLEISKPPGF
jgi:hypothetical protein